MKKITANTLDAALIEATKEFNCSLTQIEYEVIQNPSNGIFGFLKKEAIIVATKKENSSDISMKNIMQQTQIINDNLQLNTKETQQDSINSTLKQEEIEQIKDNVNHNSITTTSTQQSMDKQNIDNKNINDKDIKDKQTMQTLTHNVEDNPKIDTVNTNTENVSTLLKDEKYSQLESSNIDSNADKADIETKQANEHSFTANKRMQNDFDSIFYDRDSVDCQDSIKQDLQQIKDIESTCKEVQTELTELLQFLPLKLSRIQVEPYDNHTIFVVIDGLDAALLIGQKGYRYKSLSYLLFNWINACYGYNVRLEIAQFLKNQEDMMKSYLDSIIETAKLQGKAQTKALDGVLIHIALKILRDALPNKYIVFRENDDGEKYITINEFLNNNTRNSINGFGNLPKY